MAKVIYSKDSIWDIVERSLATPRCVCGCGRWSSEDTFATPECFNKEEADCVY